jgi:hypothetical protein
MMRRFLFALPSALGMKILSRPVVRYCQDPGNEGIRLILAHLEHASVASILA